MAPVGICHLLPLCSLLFFLSPASTMAGWVTYAFPLSDNTGGLYFGELLFLLLRLNLKHKYQEVPVGPRWQTWLTARASWVTGITGLLAQEPHSRVSADSHLSCWVSRAWSRLVRAVFPEQGHELESKKRPRVLSDLQPLGSQPTGSTCRNLLNARPVPCSSAFHVDADCLHPVSHHWTSCSWQRELVARWDRPCSETQGHTVRRGF